MFHLCLFFILGFQHDKLQRHWLGCDVSLHARHRSGRTICYVLWIRRRNDQEHGTQCLSLLLFEYEIPEANQLGCLFGLRQKRFQLDHPRCDGRGRRSPPMRIAATVPFQHRHLPPWSMRRVPAWARIGCRFLVRPRQTRLPFLSAALMVVSYQTVGLNLNGERISKSNMA